MAGFGLAGLMLPNARLVAAEQLLAPADAARNKALADAALAQAKTLGASYCDIRIGRYLNQAILTRERLVQNVTNAESSGIGIRVIVNGAWGFAASHQQTTNGVRETVAHAVAIARANARLRDRPVHLAPTPGVGEVQWQTPFRKNAMAVPIKDKVELLLAINAAALSAGADFINSQLFLVNEQKYFASSDGSWIDQDVHRIWLPFTATAVDKASGKFRTRNGLSAPMGMGWEFLDGDAAGKYALPGGVTGYGRAYDPLEDAVAAARQARQKLKAPSVKPGKYDLILDPSNLFLTIHENVGHPLELDRVLGYEANYAGTSFATVDKLGSFRYGSPIVNLVADGTVPGGLATRGYDDDGVRQARWPIVERGVLRGYATNRELAHRVEEPGSRGCNRAETWGDIPIVRINNLSLMPGDTSWDDLVAGVEDGVIMDCNRSWSIDQRRLNFQFGCEIGWRVRKGRITGLVRNPTYQGMTPDFWGSCDGICGPEAWELVGISNCGKGQPGQTAHMSHGSSPARFRGVQVGISA